MYLKWILYPKKSWVPSFGSSVTLDPAGANRFGWEIRVNWQNTTGKKQQQKQQETNTDSIQKKKTSNIFQLQVWSMIPRERPMIGNYSLLIRHHVWWLRSRSQGFHRFHQTSNMAMIRINHNNDIINKKNRNQKQ